MPIPPIPLCVFIQCYTSQIYIYTFIYIYNYTHIYNYIYIYHEFLRMVLFGMSPRSGSMHKARAGILWLLWQLCEWLPWGVGGKRQEPPTTTTTRTRAGTRGTTATQPPPTKNTACMNNHEHTWVDHIRRTLDHKIKIESRTWRRASRP